LPRQAMLPPAHRAWMQIHNLKAGKGKEDRSRLRALRCNLPQRGASR